MEARLLVVILTIWTFCSEVLISTLTRLQVDKKKKEKKDKERENEKEKSALTKERVQKRRQTTSPSTTIQRSRPEARYWFSFM